MGDGAERYVRREWIYAIFVILCVTGLAYLPLIIQLGLYREDWYLIWNGEARTLQDFVSLYQVDRPFVGYIYKLVYPFLGSTPLNWHIQAFLLRLIGVLAFFSMIRMLWPDRRFATTAAAILFAVYPGYLQQYNAVNKTFWLTSLTLALLSLALTVFAVQSRKRYQAILATLFAILLSAIYPLIIEFYIGFEAVRFILIWFAWQKRDAKPTLASLKRALLWYLPYLVSPVIFLVWRLFLFESTRPTTNVDRLLAGYLTLPRHMLARLIVETPQDFYETIALAWGVPPYQVFSQLTNREFLAGLILGGVAVLLTLSYYRWLKNRDLILTGQDSPNWTREMMWIGAITASITLLPMILAGREVDFSAATREDHYTIQSAIGATLFLIGFFYAILKPKLRLAVMCALIGISVMTQFGQLALKRNDWVNQKNVWWQLAWRAPQLIDGTLLLVNMPPGSGMSEGYETWAPANLIYSQDAEIPRLTGEVLYPGIAVPLQAGSVEPKNHRNIRFKLDYGKALVLSKPSQYACLNVIDGSWYQLPDDEEFSIRYAAPYSRIGEVVTGQPFSTPPEAIFGPEPDHTWCYYYQKAMYARQIGDWVEIARLGDEARQRGFEPADQVEWRPFLEGYIQAGRAADAAAIALEIKKDRSATRVICQQLESSASLPQNTPRGELQALLCDS